MNILINAYACAPNWGSEQGMAWHWITELAHEHTLYVITEGEWRTEIEEALTHLDVAANIHFYYNPVSAKVRAMCWNQGDWRFYWYYRQWQKKTLAMARQICRDHRIDLIHQLNMIGFREPGYLWKIEKVSYYVWGPVGGMEIIPISYLAGMPVAKKVKYIVKNLLNLLQIRYAPRVCKAIKRGDKVIAATVGTYRAISRLHHADTVFMSEAGCVVSDTPQAHDFNKDHIDILWVGRFLDTKRLDIAINTMAKLHGLPITLHIVGNGNETENVYYHHLASEAGVDTQIKWYGRVPNAQVQEMMRSMDLFFFTSVLEGTPHVVLEAISNGMPVLCIDTCGQGMLVNDQVGWKVALSNPAKNVEDFVALLRSLLSNRKKLEQKSANCLRRRYELSWNNKVVQMNNIYRQIERKA